MNNLDCGGLLDNNPSVSTIVTVYNQYAFIEKTLSSVLSQTYHDQEVIVVDDGSSDGSREWLREHAKQGRFRLVEQDNSGVSNARNRGAEYAKGRYLAFLDGDDLWAPDKLERQVSLMGNNPTAALVYGNVLHFAGTPPEMPTPSAEPSYSVHPSGNVYSRLLKCCFITSPGQTLIRKEIFLSVGGFSADFKGVEDYDLYIRLARCGEFICDSHYSFLYRHHSNNFSKKYELMYQSLILLRKSHFGKYPKLHNHSQWLVISIGNRRTYYILALRNAQRSIYNREYYQAMKHVCNALLKFPVGIVGGPFIRFLKFAKSHM